MKRNQAKEFVDFIMESEQMYVYQRGDKKKVFKLMGNWCLHPEKNLLAEVAKWIATYKNHNDKTTLAASLVVATQILEKKGNGSAFEKRIFRWLDIQQVSTFSVTPRILSIMQRNGVTTNYSDLLYYLSGWDHCEEWAQIRIILDMQKSSQGESK